MILLAHSSKLSSQNWVAKGANHYSSRSFTQNVLTYGDSISKQFECTLAIWKNQRFHKLIPVWNSWDLRERPFLSNIIWIRHLELLSSLYLYLKCSQVLVNLVPRAFPFGIRKRKSPGNDKVAVPLIPAKFKFIRVRSTLSINVGR